MARDLLLSSGFLAFARHLGVLQELERRREPIEAVVGTSSGALIGALWAAGHEVETITAWIEERRPLSLMRPTLRPWRGLMTLAPLVHFLRQRLPASFDDLQRPLAVGVVDTDGQHLLLTAGDLASAVAASCAMPYVFQPVSLGAALYQDGGAADRLGLTPWRRWRPERSCIAHRVKRTAGLDLAGDFTDVTLIETPRSGANFWRLGDVRAQRLEAMRIAATALDRG